MRRSEPARCTSIAIRPLIGHLKPAFSGFQVVVVSGFNGSWLQRFVRHLL